MAGVPAHWRTSVMDADSDPEFVRVWMEEVDAISRWTSGRFSDEEGADRCEEEKIKEDVQCINEHNDRWELKRGTMRKIDYIPVVFPGGSVRIIAFVTCRAGELTSAQGYNLSEGKWSWNDCPRKGGNFMWRQLFNVRRHNVRTIYGAMWDEYVLLSEISMSMCTDCIDLDTMKVPHSCRLYRTNTSCPCTRSTGSWPSTKMDTIFHRTGTCAYVASPRRASAATA